jgi:hypothetical protein
MLLLAYISSICTIFAGFGLTLAGSVTQDGSTCTVHADANGADDGPAVKQAFTLCNRDSAIVFGPETFHIESVLETVELSNVTVDIRGTLLVGLAIILFRHVDSFRC